MDFAVVLLLFVVVSQSASQEEDTGERVVGQVCNVLLGHTPQTCRKALRGCLYLSPDRRPSSQDRVPFHLRSLRLEVLLPMPRGRTGRIWPSVLVPK
jgi:hypothetical protein